MKRAIPRGLLHLKVSHEGCGLASADRDGALERQVARHLDAQEVAAWLVHPERDPGPVLEEPPVDGSGGLQPGVDLEDMAAVYDRMDELG